MATKDTWIVHPNRSQIGPDVPGQNGHMRSVRTSRPRPAGHLPYQIRVQLPAALAAELRHSYPDGWATFAGNAWRLAIVCAREFSIEHINADAPPPIGFLRRGRWWWWDGSTADHDILSSPDAPAYARRYLEALFPGCKITITHP